MGAGGLVVWVWFPMLAHSHYFLLGYLPCRSQLCCLSLIVTLWVGKLFLFSYSIYSVSLCIKKLIPSVFTCSCLIQNAWSISYLFFFFQNCNRNTTCTIYIQNEWSHSLFSGERFRRDNKVSILGGGTHDSLFFFFFICPQQHDFIELENIFGQLIFFNVNCLPWEIWCR